MAQSTKSSRSSGSSRSAKRPSSKSSKATSSNGSRAKGTSSNGSRAKSASRSRSGASSRNGAGASKETAIRKAGHAAAEAASKAKVPLIAGGTALVGAAAGVLIKDRLGVKPSKNPIKRLSAATMLRPAAKLDLGKLDIGMVKSAAERVSVYGQQASDIASAVEKTRKKNK